VLVFRTVTCVVVMHTPPVDGGRRHLAAGCKAEVLSGCKFPGDLTCG
jgi:hypothetical protein